MRNMLGTLTKGQKQVLAKERYPFFRTGCKFFLSTSNVLFCLISCLKYRHMIVSFTRMEKLTKARNKLQVISPFKTDLEY